MKILRYIVLAAIVAAAAFATEAQAKKKAEPRVKMYMFGFAASFNDTIVHFTDIQALDSVWINTKYKYMLGRENYSSQLRDYLESQRMAHRTCAVFYNQDRQKLEKEYLKMKRIYTTGKKKVKKKDQNSQAKSHYDIRELTIQDFSFHFVDMSGVYHDE